MSIRCERANPVAFRQWTGIPAPEDRWRMLKTLFLHKIITDKHTTRTIIHQWIHNGKLTNECNTYKEMTESMDMLMPGITMDKILEMKKAEVVAIMHKTIYARQLALLPEHHPLRALDWTPKGFKAFAILNFDALNNRFPDFNAREVDPITNSSSDSQTGMKRKSN